MAPVSAQSAPDGYSTTRSAAGISMRCVRRWLKSGQIAMLTTPTAKAMSTVETEKVASSVSAG